MKPDPNRDRSKTKFVPYDKNAYYAPIEQYTKARGEEGIKQDVAKAAAAKKKANIVYQKIKPKAPVKKKAVTTYKLPSGKTTTVKPEYAKGAKVSWESVITAFNPFSKERVHIDPAVIQNTIIRNGLEEAFNNPYTTALIATGVIQLGKAALSKVVYKASGKEAMYRVGFEQQKFQGQMAAARAGVSANSGTTVTHAVNTKTIKLSNKLLVKAGFSVAAILAIKDAVGTYPFAQFEISEALQSLGMARWKAYEAGNKDLMDELDQLQEEILNPVGWEKIIAAIPWTNVQRAATKNIIAAEASRKVFNKIMEDEIFAKENGLSSDDKWTKIRQDEADQDKAAIDYYNSERKKLVSWEKEAQTAARKSKRADEIKARNEDAAFWAKQAAKQKELEAADRKAIADFWAAYRKQMQKISEDSRPSKLNFGIL